MNSIDQSLLESRFELRNTRYISERFELSPKITERCSVSDHLLIRYSAPDASFLPLIRSSFVRAYGYVQEWFGCNRDIPFALWVAPAVSDLRYMTCLPCDEGFSCAPGSLDGWRIILFISPQVCRRNSDPDSLSGLLAHEISHHVVRTLSLATELTMKRSEGLDLPMWLEEGLCQLIQGEIHHPFRQRLDEQVARTTEWYEPDELWNDLSSCRDVKTAYLQAYRDIRALVETKGRQDVIRLLHRNRTRDVNWVRIESGY
jgi:hypothetical protein